MAKQGRDAHQVSASSDDVFTKAISLFKNERFTLSASGTFSATLTYQRRFDGANWFDAEQYTAPTARDGIAAEPMDIRFGIKTGDYTSGTAIIRLGK